VKVGGYVITINLFDDDPFPTWPHGHDVQTGNKIDKFGNIYDKNSGKIVGNIGKKNVRELIELAKKEGVFSRIQKLGRQLGKIAKPLAVGIFMYEALYSGPVYASEQLIRDALFLDEIEFLRRGISIEKESVCQ